MNDEELHEYLDGCREYHNGLAGDYVQALIRLDAGEMDDEEKERYEEEAREEDV